MGEHAQVLEAQLGVAAGRALVGALGEGEEVVLEARGSSIATRRAERLAVEGDEALRAAGHALDVVAAPEVELEAVEAARARSGSLPQTHGEVAAGGAYGAKMAKKSPARPSGVKLIIPIVPPGRVTRSSSRGDRAVVGGEDRAGGAGDDVEGVVVEREVLRVGLDPFDLETARLGLAAAERELLGRDVAAR